MELRHLRYLLVVAELLNFTKAANKLRVAQPALSRQIQDLENELGVKLLERNSRIVRLTDVGKLFAEEAKEIVARADLAVKAAQAFAKGDRGQIEVGFAPSLTVEILPKALKAFERRCPQVQVNLHDLSIQEMHAGLKQGTLHIAFTLEPPAPTVEITFQPLRTYPICVAVHPGHRFARMGSLNSEALKGERFLVYAREEYPEYHEWLRTIFTKESGISLATAEEHDSGPSIIAAIESGRGIAIVPSIIASAAGPRVKFKRLKPSPPPMVVGLAYVENHLSPAARKFVNSTITSPGPQVDA